MVKTRLARLRALMRRRKLDGLLVNLPANRRYLSGFTPDDGQIGESSGALFISQGQAVILTDFRYELTANEQARLFTTRIYRQGLAAELVKLVEEMRVKRLGFEADALLVSQHERLAKALEGVELAPTTGLVSELRVRKDPAELMALQASLDLMEEVLDRALDQDLVGKTELEVARAMVRALEDAGAEGPAFPLIVASGPQAAEPHAEPGPRVIQAGETVIFDVGARVDGYVCDISRTVVAGGLERASGPFREVYDTVRRAQVAAIEGIRPGMTGQDADAIARRIIEQAGHGARFGHSLGHGVGLDTHEAPSLSPRSTDVLQPGMVFTIEPGIYLPGWGGVRLEQMTLLTEDGCCLLNNLGRFYGE